MDFHEESRNSSASNAATAWHVGSSRAAASVPSTEDHLLSIRRMVRIDAVLTLKVLTNGTPSLRPGAMELVDSINKITPDLENNTAANDIISQLNLHRYTGRDIFDSMYGAAVERLWEVYNSQTFDVEKLQLCSTRFAEAMARSQQAGLNILERNDAARGLNSSDPFTENQHPTFDDPASWWQMTRPHPSALMEHQQSPSDSLPAWYGQ